ncbi:MAG: hypothetical protein Kow00106_05880 [Anaerolineae bacterium]
MPDPLDSSLRASLEAWERQVAAEWDAFVRAPGTLRRIGAQIHQTLLARQRLIAALEARGLYAASAEQQWGRLLYLLERLDYQLRYLADRLDRLESALNDDDDD